VGNPAEKPGKSFNVIASPPGLLACDFLALRGTVVMKVQSRQGVEAAHPASPTTRLVAIDALRGLAAAAVVLTHIPRQTHGEFDWLFFSFLPLDFGTLGVPLFIVLSGFCIHLATAQRTVAGDRPQVNWGRFWKRRFVRLYPAYVAAIVFSLATYAFAKSTGNLLPSQRLTSLWTDLSTHLVMVHNVTADFATGLNNPAFWTLALEEQLYGLFAVLLVLRRRMSITRIVWIALTVSLAWRLGVVWFQFVAARGFDIPRESHILTLGPLPAIGSWTMWAFGWWFLWVLGAAAAEAHSGALRLPQWCYSWRVALAAAAFGAPTYFRTLGVYTTYYLNDHSTGWLRVGLQSIGALSEPAFAVACFVVVNRWCRDEREGHRPGRWMRGAAAVGVFSYSLYLVHFPTIFMLEAYLPVGERQNLLHGVARIMVYVPICLVVAYIFFQAVERRCLRRPRATAYTAKSRVGLAYEATDASPG
jgi:peptidoglycan/LPS O-acetylase OafA/YrhL